MADCLLYCFNHHGRVVLRQVVAVHAGFPRSAGGDKDDVGSGGVREIARPGDMRRLREDWDGLLQVHRLALGQPRDDIEQDDVA